jgi:hypothetical protein
MKNPLFKIGESVQIQAPGKDCLVEVGYRSRPVTRRHTTGRKEGETYEGVEYWTEYRNVQGEVGTVTSYRGSMLYVVQFANGLEGQFYVDSLRNADGTRPAVGEARSQRAKEVAERRKGTMLQPGKKATVRAQEAFQLS